ncbi:AraC family transcriptional regulator [Marinobacter sp. NP-4(2019)]|uniref:AraC family transcriptional regulator n=1 Tax=Marinobacter sp. NP-4(2019) TaxID=2488665 RepID=UPI001D196CDE|nr:AraC family transcriptional regulator [Marinobacter sp. NP-4(2019)]
MFTAEQVTGSVPDRGRLEFTVIFLAVFGHTLFFPTLATANELNAEINRLKADVISLAGEVFALEEGILHPADTQVTVFLTLARKDALTLDSVELYVDDTPVASHLYTDRELNALAQGGVQQLYTGNLPHGHHVLKTVLTARAGNDRYVRRESTYRFQKQPGQSRIAMTLDARAPDYEPQVSFREWK